MSPSTGDAPALSFALPYALNVSRVRKRRKSQRYALPPPCAPRTIRRHSLRFCFPGDGEERQGEDEERQGRRRRWRGEVILSLSLPLSPSYSRRLFPPQESLLSSRIRSVPTCDFDEFSPRRRETPSAESTVTGRSAAWPTRHLASFTCFLPVACVSDASDTLDSEYLAWIGRFIKRVWRSLPLRNEATPVH